MQLVRLGDGPAAVRVTGQRIRRCLPALLVAACLSIAACADQADKADQAFRENFRQTTLDSCLSKTQLKRGLTAARREVYCRCSAAGIASTSTIEELKALNTLPAPPAAEKKVFDTMSKCARLAGAH